MESFIGPDSCESNQKTIVIGGVCIDEGDGDDNHYYVACFGKSSENALIKAP